MTVATSFTAEVAPGARPVVGHALRFRRRPLEFLTSLRSCAGRVRIRLGPSHAYVTCHPDLVQEVLAAPRIFDKGGRLFDIARVVLGNSLVTCSWHEHRRQRALLQPAFHRARLPGYAALMQAEIGSVTASWRPGQTIDVKATFDSLTLRVGARTLFSTDLGLDAEAEIQRSMPIFSEGAFKRVVASLVFLDGLPTPGNRAFRAAVARVHAVIDTIVDDYRASGIDHGDLLSLLVTARDDQSGEGLTDQEIHDQVVTFLAASTETTSNLLCWTMLVLSEHPEVERQLHDEVDRELDGRLPGWDDIGRLDYTRRTITEVLRLYPPIWLLTRKTTADCVLGGHPVPAGAMIVFSPYLVHRDPRLFADAERFDPDRWLPERAESAPRGSLVPFGGGSRKCIGDSFGMTEATITLAAIASRWQLRPVPGQVTRAPPRATLMPDPLRMVVQARSG
ncbi:MAG: cyclooctatin synthase [Actinomycetota bacterium]|nr:cyclooctatin synthase [Actinomycetota bacterium]